MKAIQLSRMKEFRISRFWLLVMAAALAVINLTLAWKGGKQGFLAFSFLFWAAAGSMFWDKRQQLRLGSGWVSCSLGAALIAGTLFWGAVQPGDIVFACSPFVSVLGLALMASGRRRLGQYRQELIILFFLGLPKLMLPLLPDISPLTARFASFSLWYTGFPVSLHEDIHIVLPAGGVEVVPRCSGLNLMSYMLGISAIFLVMFPTRRFQKIVAPVVAVSLGFLVNGVRIAMLAAFSGYSPDLFDYFHNRGGSLFFVTIAVMLFGLYCWFSIGQMVSSSNPGAVAGGQVGCDRNTATKNKVPKVKAKQIKEGRIGIPRLGKR